ncbi:tetratricopeptide repeat protein, partial [Methanobrevibacter woesei]
DLNKSIKLMDKALKSYDNFSEDEKPRITEEDIWMGKIELLVKKNDKKETLAELNNFEKEYPDNPKMILYKGILLSETGEDENALKYLETSLKRDNTILALNAKGNALYNLRRYSEALEVYNKCISHEKEVDDLDIKTNFNSKAAFSAIELENYNEAIKYLNKTINMLNEHGRLKNDLEKIYRQCSFEKERLLKQYNIQDRKFSRFKFLSSKTALILLILFIIGYFILTYLGY